jgi:uncharacterized membrane protein YhaH (DUF805 family)
MRRNFWKAVLISLAANIAAILIGFGAGFQYTLFLVVALQLTWTLFCVIRLIQLRRTGGHKPDAPEYDQESYGFALGGSISAFALLLVMVVLSQAG